MCSVVLCMLWRGEGGVGWGRVVSAEQLSAVRVPPRRGPGSSVKGYVSFSAASPPACLCLTFALLLRRKEHAEPLASSQ